MNETWDGNKQTDYSRISRKLENSYRSANIEPSADFSTFSVSFMRTESKIRASPSPREDIPSILDVPKKKKYDKKRQYDLISGDERGQRNGQTVKVREEKMMSNSSVVEGAQKSETEKVAGFIDSNRLKK